MTGSHPGLLASDVTLSKALNCSGLIFLCRMKSSLTSPSGSHHAHRQVNAFGPCNGDDAT